MTMNAMNERAFELHEVSVTNLAWTKLEKFSIKVFRGEAVALVGQSGSGKTAVLRLVAGLTEPTTGVVRVLGERVAMLGYEARRALFLRVGYAFEMTGIWGNRTVRDNIGLPLAYHAVTDAQHAAVSARVNDLAAELGIDRVLEVNAMSVAGSVRKRALIARALAHEPEILLCDEPQAGLIPREAKRVSDAFERRRKSRDMTVIIADHDGYLHPYIARRVLYLEDGKLADRPSRMPTSIHDLALTLEANRTVPPPHTPSSYPPRGPSPDELAASPDMPVGTFADMSASMPASMSASMSASMQGDPPSDMSSVTPFPVTRRATSVVPPQMPVEGRDESPFEVPIESETSSKD